MVYHALISEVTFLFCSSLFWGVLCWKRKAEEALIASGVPYTVRFYSAELVLFFLCQLSSTE